VTTRLSVESVRTSLIEEHLALNIRIHLKEFTTLHRFHSPGPRGVGLVAAVVTEETVPTND
jgi:hypothetical protein